MNKPPAYQYYPGDIQRDTAHLTNEEFGAYQRLLNYSWFRRGIPIDMARCATIVSTSVEYFEQNLWPALSEFWVQNGHGNLVNPRQEKERKKQEEYRKQQSDAGKKGADSRWHGEANDKTITTPSQEYGKAIGEANDETIALQSSSSSLSSTSKKTKDSPELKKPVQDQPSHSLSKESDGMGSRSAGPQKIDFNWKSKEFTGITPAQLIEWAQAYPAVDIPQEIKKAREWLLSNPEKRKKRYRRFLTTWFNRTQERGGTKGFIPKKPAETRGRDATAQVWDEEEAKRKEANERWRGLDAHDRKPYIEKAAEDPRRKLMGKETVAFLIFSEELNVNRESDRDPP